jgi:hypothetical protein
MLEGLKRNGNGNGKANESSMVNENYWCHGLRMKPCVSAPMKAPAIAIVIAIATLFNKLSEKRKKDRVIHLPRVE